MNLYLPNNEVSKYIKQKMTALQGEIHTPMLILGGFCMSLSDINDKCINSKDMQDLQYEQA